MPPGLWPLAAGGAPACARPVRRAPWQRRRVARRPAGQGAAGPYKAPPPLESAAAAAAARARERGEANRRLAATTAKAAERSAEQMPGTVR